MKRGFLASLVILLLPVLSLAQERWKPKKEAIAQGLYSVGGNVKAPVAIYEPDPPYTHSAKKHKEQGTVVLSLIVDEKGAVRNAAIVAPLEHFHL